MSAAACFECLSVKQLRAVRIYLKCAQLNGTKVNCSTKTLLASAISAGLMEISEKQQMAVETYLDCQLNNSGGGGSGNLSGSGSPVGVVTPSAAGVLYADYTTPGLWESNGTTNTSWIQLI